MIDEHSMADTNTEALKKHPGGRPTKLTPELISKAKEYLDSCEGFNSTMLPTIEGLGLYLDIYRDTIYDWEKTDASPEFSDIVKRLRQAQAHKLMQNSLQGRYNPMISKLLLSKHGYVEKTESDQKNTGTITIQTVNYAAADNPLPVRT